MADLSVSLSAWIFGFAFLFVTVLLPLSAAVRRNRKAFLSGSFSRHSALS